MEVLWFEQTVNDIALEDDWLSKAERGKLRTLRIPKRHADWRLGRWTAKQAVARALDIPTSRLATIELHAAASGAPSVFIGGDPARMTISLSHSEGTAVCAVTHGPAVLGCDVELVATRTNLFVADYFTDSEQQLAASAANGDRDLLVNLIWSAKESALKSLRTGLRLDTRAVEVRLDEATAAAIPRTLSGETPSWQQLAVASGEQVLAGWWFSSGQLVRTLVCAQCVPVL